MNALTTLPNGEPGEMEALDVDDLAANDAEAIVTQVALY